MPKKKSPNSMRLRNSTAEFLTFAYQTGGDGVEVRVLDGTIWLSQKASACSLRRHRKTCWFTSRRSMLKSNCLKRALCRAWPHRRRAGREACGP
jgi:hypothetical protein